MVRRLRSLIKSMRARPRSRGARNERQVSKARQERKRREIRARLRRSDLENRLEKLERQLEGVRAVLAERGPTPWDSGVDRPAWEAAKAHEVGWWRSWLETRGLAWPQDYAERFDPELPLQHHIRRCLKAPPGSTVSILDVGAGPLTSLGKTWEGRRIDITAVDPLAGQYQSLLAEFGITPLVETQPGEVERLTRLFPRQSFDAVHMRNALDHSLDPLLGVRQMLEVTKPGGAVILWHAVNEAHETGYVGFHQWNLCPDEGDLLIWNRYARFRVGETLGEGTKVTVEQEGDGVVLACLRKRPAAA